MLFLIPTVACVPFDTQVGTKTIQTFLVGNLTIEKVSQYVTDHPILIKTVMENDVKGFIDTVYQAMTEHPELMNSFVRNPTVWSEAAGAFIDSYQKTYATFMTTGGNPQHLVDRRTDIIGKHPDVVLKMMSIPQDDRGTGRLFSAINRVMDRYPQILEMELKADYTKEREVLDKFIQDQSKNAPVHQESSTKKKLGFLEASSDE